MVSLIELIYWPIVLVLALSGGYQIEIKTYGTIKNRFFQEIKEYCECTSLSGFSYAVSDIKHFLRLFWGLVVLIFGIIGLYLTINSLIDYGRYPTELKVKEFDAEVLNLTYPTITFCPVQEYDR